MWYLNMLKLRRTFILDSILQTQVFKTVVFELVECNFLIFLLNPELFRSSNFMSCSCQQGTYAHYLKRRDNACIHFSLSFMLIYGYMCMRLCGCTGNYPKGLLCMWGHLIVKSMVAKESSVKWKHFLTAPFKISLCQKKKFYLVLRVTRY